MVMSEGWWVGGFVDWRRGGSWRTPGGRPQLGVSAHDTLHDGCVRLTPGQTRGTGEVWRIIWIENADWKCQTTSSIKPDLRLEFWSRIFQHYYLVDDDVTDVFQQNSPMATITAKASPHKRTTKIPPIFTTPRALATVWKKVIKGFDKDNRLSLVQI